MPSRLSRSALPLFAALLTGAAAAQTPIQITADLSDTPRHLYHAEIDIPVKPGPHPHTLAEPEPPCRPERSPAPAPLTPQSQKQSRPVTEIPAPWV